jgi:hypothetical protein
VKFQLSACVHLGAKRYGVAKVGGLTDVVGVLLNTKTIKKFLLK